MAERVGQFGALLRRYRLAAGLSQDALAEKAGLTPNAIGALERGYRRNPYPETVRRLAVGLGLTDAERAQLIAARDEGGSATAPQFDPPTAPALAGIPHYLEPLIGRERDSEALLDLLGRADTRLLTIVGPGGVGKTRLVVEVARHVAPLFPDGVAFVSLASLIDPALVLPTVGQALGLHEAGGPQPREFIQAFLRDRRLLLVLDNFEHVLTAAPEVAALQQACPQLVVLATSRAPLRLRGEREWALAPLDLPDADTRTGVSALADTPAVALLVQRVRQVTPSFTLTSTNAPVIAAICRRLDGLPLAIELAAARMKLLSPAGLLGRLDRALPLLTDGPRDLPARQRTMRDAIAWSEGLLEPAERSLFTRLAVFAGGWTIAAAEAICGERGDGTMPDLLHQHSALLDHSLAIRQADDHAGETPRFGMLGTIREYALGRLTSSGEEASVRERHAAYFLTLAEEAEPTLIGPGQASTLTRLALDVDNLRTALTWYAEVGSAEEGQRLAGALFRFWWARGDYAEGRSWLDTFLGRAPQGPSAPRAKAAGAAALLLYRMGDFATARALSAESLQIDRALGDRRASAWSLGTLALTHEAEGDRAMARQLFEEALALSRAVDDRIGIARALSNLADNARFLGEWDRAATLYEECLVIDRELGNAEGIAVRQHNLGYVALREGSVKRAATLLAKSLRGYLPLGHQYGLLAAVEGLAGVAAAGGLDDRAARLFAAATTLRQRLSAPVDPVDRPEQERRLAAARTALGEAAFAIAWAEGTRLSLEEAIEEGLRIAALIADE